MESGAGMRFADTANLPSNMAVGATGDPQYARRQGEIIAREARALGVTQIFGPVADVNNNPDNPIINVRAYSGDPTVVATFSTTFINGAQSNGVIATAKHFPGHGNTEVDSHRGLPVIFADRSSLKQTELLPFIATIKAGVAAVMVAYIGLPKIDATEIKPLPEDKVTRPAYVAKGQEIVIEKATLPAALSPVIVEGLLRKELGFEGLVVTDALDMSALTLYFRQDEAAVRAVEAGADMLIKPSDPDAAVGGLREAVQTGRITEKRIEESARRILAAKYDLGLVQSHVTPLNQIDLSLSNSEVFSFANEVAEHAITLVRNDSKLIPVNLPPDATVFNLAITNGDDRLTIAAPFEAELKRYYTNTDTVVLDERSSVQEISEAIKKAQAANLVIASLYGRVRAGEPLSAALPESSTHALTKLINQKLPIIGISFGTPYLLQSFPKLPTYLVAYGDMPSLQEAAARALVGKIDITGRLPVMVRVTQDDVYKPGDGIQLKVGPQAR
jgi:beta-N-acetylhexosaminidase